MPTNKIEACNDNMTTTGRQVRGSRLHAIATSAPKLTFPVPAGVISTVDEPAVAIDEVGHVLCS